MKVGQLFRERMVRTLKEGVKDQDNVFMLSYSNLSGLAISDLRKDLGRVGAVMYVSRNSIIKRALQDIEYEELAKQVKGQMAFVWSNSDSAEVSKILTKFAKDCEGVTLRGGVLQGSILKEQDIQKLADLPSREVLLAMLLGTIQAPLSRLAGALNGKTRELLSILQQLSEKKGGKENG